MMCDIWVAKVDVSDFSIQTDFCKTQYNGGRKLHLENIIVIENNELSDPVCAEELRCANVSRRLIWWMRAQGSQTEA